MADFNVSLSAPQGAGAQVLPTVQNNVQNFPDPMIGFAAGLASAFISSREETDKRKKEELKKSVIGEFTRSQTTLHEALAQGANTSQVNARARSNFAKYAAANPEFVDEFSKINKSLFEYTELGQAKDVETAFKDAEKAEINDMVKAGYPVSKDMPIQALDANRQAFRATRAADEELQRISRLNAERRSQSSEERASFEFENKQNVVKVLSAIGDTHLTSTKENLELVLAEAKKSGDTETARTRIFQMFGTIRESITAASSLNPELAKPYNALFDEMQKFAFERLDGKTEATASENQLKALQNKIQLTTLASPENKALYGISKVFNGPIPSTFFNANKAAQDSFVQLTSKFGGADIPSVVGNKEKETLAYSMIKNQVSAIEAGKAHDAEGTKVELGNAANNLLKQIGNAPANGLKSESLSAAANFIASPEYAKLMSYGKIDSEAANAANRVFSMMYEKDVAKGIYKKMNESFDRTVPREQQETYGNLVEFKWNGARVVPEKVEIGTGKDWLNRTEMQNRDVFIRDMKSSSEALNQLVRAGAHMEGHTNYQKYWDENKHRMLPNYYPDPAQLKEGQVVNGYRYKGGNVKVKSNWIKEESAQK